MTEGAHEVGYEEKYLEKNEKPRQTGRNVRNFLVTTFKVKRDPAAIRTEMIQASIHFLTQRLSIEEETAVEAMQNLVKASTTSEFVTAARPLFSAMPTSFNRRDFDILKPSSFIRQDDYSVLVFHMLCR